MSSKADIGRLDVDPQRIEQQVRRDAQRAALSIKSAKDKLHQEMQPYVAVLASPLGGLRQIRLPEATTAGTEEYARLVGFEPQFNSDVLVIDVNGVPFILGEIQRTDNKIHTITSSQSNALLVRRVDANVFVVDTANPASVHLRSGAPLQGYSDSNGTIKTWELDSSTGHLTFFGEPPAFTTFNNGAGVGANLTASGTDGSFRVTLTTGSGPGTGTIFSVAFVNDYASNTYQVTFSATDADAAAAIASVYVDHVSKTAGGFNFVARAALAASTSYRWDFKVTNGITP